MPDLPAGTVTFLFTDVEGSTRLAERHPQAMRDAQVRHDALVREAITAHGGAVFRPTGDGVCAVFATAPTRWPRPWRPSAPSRSSPGRAGIRGCLGRGPGHDPGAGYRLRAGGARAGLTRGGCCRRSVGCRRTLPPLA